MSAADPIHNFGTLLLTSLSLVLAPLGPRPSSILSIMWSAATAQKVDPPCASSPGPCATPPSCVKLHLTYSAAAVRSKPSQRPSRRQLAAAQNTKRMSLSPPSEEQVKLPSGKKKDMLNNDMRLD